MRRGERSYDREVTVSDEKYLRVLGGWKEGQRERKVQGGRDDETNKRRVVSVTEPRTSVEVRNCGPESGSRRG